MTAIGYYAYSYCSIQRYRVYRQYRQNWFRSHWWWYAKQYLHYHFFGFHQRSKDHCWLCGSRRSPEHDAYCNARDGEWYYMDDERKYLFLRQQDLTVDLENRMVIVKAYSDEDPNAIRTQVNDLLKPLRKTGNVKIEQGRIGGCYDDSNQYVDIIGNIYSFPVVQNACTQQEREGMGFDEHPSPAKTFDLDSRNVVKAE